MPFEPGADEEVQVPQDGLMPRVRRGRHIMLPVDQLMPPPVIREEEEVVVRQLDARRIPGQVLTPRHALILPSSATDVPGGDQGVRAGFCVRRFAVRRICADPRSARWQNLHRPRIDVRCSAHRAGRWLLSCRPCHPKAVVGIPKRRIDPAAGRAPADCHRVPPRPAARGAPHAMRRPTRVPLGRG